MSEVNLQDIINANTDSKPARKKPGRKAKPKVATQVLPEAPAPEALNVEPILISVKDYGYRAPNLIPDNEVIPFAAVNLRGIAEQRAYQLQELLNEMNSIVMPRGGHMSINRMEGTWTVTNSFGAQECGTFFQPPNKILGIVRALFTYKNADKELRLGNWVDEKYNLHLQERTNLSHLHTGRA